MARRRPGTLFPLELDILDVGTVLQSTDGSFYGFALAKQLAATGDTALTAHGTLYKALSRMADAGLIEATWEDPEVAEADGRPRRRLYRITGEGATAREREHVRIAGERATSAKPAGAAWTQGAIA